jgi:hypothetical protein
MSVGGPPERPVVDGLVEVSDSADVEASSFRGVGDEDELSESSGDAFWVVDVLSVSE